MTTDEMILALVASGKFTLPEVQSDRGRIVVSPCYVEEHCYPGEDGFCNLGVFTYDVIAMHFARERWQRTNLNHQQWKRFMFDMLDGDSEAAIRALYEAVIGEAKQ